MGHPAGVFGRTDESEFGHLEEMMKRRCEFAFRCFLLLTLGLQFCATAAAQDGKSAREATPLKTADARYKADIWLLVAHAGD